jgi:hypothetical protein
MGRTEGYTWIMGPGESHKKKGRQMGECQPLVAPAWADVRERSILRTAPRIEKGRSPDHPGAR